MKKQKWFILGSIVCIIVLGLFLSKDYLPPRTPHKIARIQSQLNISSKTKVKIFEEKYSATGEGFVFIVFDLSNQEIEYLANDCQESNYKRLNTDNLINDGLLYLDYNCGIKLYKRDIRNIKDGYYQLKAEDLKSLDYGITVLDIKNKELIIFISFP
jgi:hypothetical protein